MISLNLLPPERKEMFYWRGRTKRNIVRGIKTVFMLGCFSVFLFAVNVYLVGEIDVLKIQIDSFEKTSSVQKANSIEKSFREINNIFAKINKIGEEQIYWSDVFERVAGIMPTNARLFSLEIDPDGRFIVIGKAKTRDDVLELGKRLKNSADFKDIQTPLDNLTKKEDVDFKFIGNILLDNFKAKVKVKMEKTDQI